MPKVHLSVTLEPTDLVTFDAFCASRDMGRGDAILELLKIAAAYDREQHRKGQPPIEPGGVGAGRRVVLGGDGLPYTVGSQRVPLRRDREVTLEPGERVVDPFTEEES